MQRRSRACAFPDDAASPEASRAVLKFSAAPSALHDVALHRRKNLQQLVALAQVHAMAPHGVAQQLDQDKELGFRGAEAGMRIVHGISGIFAAAAAELADHLDEVALHASKIDVLEGVLQMRVTGGVINGICNECRYIGRAAHPAIKEVVPAR